MVILGKRSITANGVTVGLRMGTDDNGVEVHQLVASGLGGISVLAESEDWEGVMSKLRHLQDRVSNRPSSLAVFGVDP